MSHGIADFFSVSFCFFYFVFYLMVYVLFLLTAAALLLLYPEDPESWLIEAGV